MNFVEINFRTLISEKISENEAGIWTAMSSISKIYMQFLITVFSIYILPKYTSLNFSHEFKNEVKAIYKTLLPIVVLGMLLVFFSKKYLILSIYNESFLAIKDEKFKNILPPLILLSQEKQKELIDKLNNLKFIFDKNLAA